MGCPFPFRRQSLKIRRFISRLRRTQFVLLIIALVLCWYFLHAGDKTLKKSADDGSDGKANRPDLSYAPDESVEDADDDSKRPRRGIVLEKPAAAADAAADDDDDPGRKTRRVSRGTWTDENGLVDTASAIAQKHGVVLFSVINDAYAQLAASWLCNTEPLGNVHSKVLFLTTDEATGRRLQRQWPEISVVFVNGSEFSGAKSYTTAAYVRLMVERTRYIQRLVKAGVRLQLFEVDFVWLADPLPTILSHRADVVGVPVYGSNGTKTCGCFLLLNPTPRTVRLWSRLTDMMEELGRRYTSRDANARVPQSDNDQMYLSKLLQERYGGVNVALLPEHLFRDGKWYWYSRLRAAPQRPLVIHNNYINGISSKIARAKKYRHWFLASDSASTDFVCDAAAVRDITATDPAEKTV